MLAGIFTLQMAKKELKKRIAMIIGTLLSVIRFELNGV